jgi:predicted acetylornithine/succinylornithine family transaminase
MKSQDDQHILGVYAKSDIHFVQGQGSWLVDVHGRRYLDFLAGIAVSALGHGNPLVLDAIRTQSEKFIHLSNLFVNAPQVELAQLLVEATGYSKVFFCNSGTEANEALIKFARKYWSVKGKPQRTEIISFSGSFHGRTYGGLSVTGQTQFQQGFGEMLPGCTVLPWNDAEALRKAVSGHTAAILLEPIEAEGGVNLPSSDFLVALKEIHAKSGVLLMSDDIQTGVGRLGRFLGCYAMGIPADLVSLAKPLGGGLPLGAVLLTAEVAACLKPGDHGSTFGGNPVACAAGVAVVKQVLASGFMDAVMRKGDLLREGLRDLAREHESVLGEVRGRGLLNGVEVKGRELPELIGALRNEGLLAARAGKDVLRFLPPLNVTDHEIGEALSIVDKVLAKG